MDVLLEFPTKYQSKKKTISNLSAIFTGETNCSMNNGILEKTMNDLPCFVDELDLHHVCLLQSEAFLGNLVRLFVLPRKMPNQM